MNKTELRRASIRLITQTVVITLIDCKIDNWKQYKEAMSLEYTKRITNKRLYEILSVIRHARDVLKKKGHNEKAKKINELSNYFEDTLIR
jgi:hypothetical protein